MTQTQQPPRCHHDPHLGRILPGEHRDDCTNPTSHRGCVPCTAPHCRICGRRHATNDEPQTCGHCIGKIRTDLTDIRTLCRQLRPQAAQAGANGRLAAAAPIPGALAQVLIGPTVPDYDDLHWSPTLRDDHFWWDAKRGEWRAKDPTPPLAVLAWWEDTWRTWLDHTPAGRASITRAIGYLDQQLSYMAQQTDGPDFAEFARSMIDLRVSLERAIHDEREPDRGVECFECGERLVRRHRDANRCTCQPRPRLPHAPHGPCTCLTEVRVEWPHPDEDPVTVQVRRRDPDDGHIHPRLDLSCIACHREAEWDRRHAGHDQGGIDDPRAGLSWECAGCRKDYDPGEYATAVRRSLMDNRDSWTTVSAAAQAAETLTGRAFGDRTIRSWITRGWVVSRRDEKTGTRLVRWPDVKREAVRVAAGLYHCKHATPARRWLKVLESYPELEVWDSEVEAARQACERCENAAVLGPRHARDSSVA